MTVSAEDIASRTARGEMLVSLQDRRVGDEYVMNWVKYKVVEICDGELEGFCWIKRDYKFEHQSEDV